MEIARAQETLAALGRTTTVRQLVRELPRELPALAGVSACLLSRVIGDLLIEISGHAADGGWTPGGHPYLSSDYPVTREALDRGEPRVVSLDDPAPDPAEAELLRELGYESVAMLPLPVGGHVWGLVELYAQAPIPAETVRVVVGLLEHAGALLGERERAATAAVSPAGRR